MANCEQYLKKTSRENIIEAVNSAVTNIPPDLTIVSGEMDKINTSKNILLLFSPTLAPLLSTPYSTSPTLFMPDCSTIYILNLKCIYLSMSVDKIMNKIRLDQFVLGK